MVVLGGGLGAFIVAPWGIVWVIQGSLGTSNWTPCGPDTGFYRFRVDFETLQDTVWGHWGDFLVIWGTKLALWVPGWVFK